ncbi:MAG: DUF1501 domain-containing protein [Pseudomonadota bacterium]
MTRLTRRRFLGSGLAIGCSAAASPLITPVALARAPGENRLVVIVLRGAMDGLDLLRPLGAPGFAALRPHIFDSAKPGHPLDGFHALHPDLAALKPLWDAGELAFIQAVSTPYRGKRSHFDGQDFLENGGYAPDGGLVAGRDGWLNRAIGLLPGADLRTAFSVGQESMLLMEGRAPVSSWTPEAQVALSAQARLLLETLYADDPVFADAARMAFDISDSTDRDTERQGAAALAAFAAEQLRGATRIAAFSIGGWDTHRGQNSVFRRALGELSAAIEALRTGLGPNWATTTVAAVTEFGRTVRENGSRGTDHGTGGTMLLAGGTLSAARVHGVWPGIGPSDLIDNRDLRPTDDMRRPLGWLLAGLYGIAPSAIERTVFPRLDLGSDPRIIA